MCILISDYWPNCMLIAAACTISTSKSDRRNYLYLLIQSIQVLERVLILNCLSQLSNHFPRICVYLFSLISDICTEELKWNRCNVDI